MHQYISSPKRTIGILSAYGIRLRKGLGQNYIIDTNTIKKIVAAADIRKGEAVLEIGSGIGSLTEILLQEGAGKVICIEIDKKVSEAFRATLAGALEEGKIELITKDAMDIDLGSLSSEYGINKMVSNLPYKIAAPLMLKILRGAPQIKTTLVTIQKDIADRILASKGDKDYSAYTVKSDLLADHRACFKVSRNCFMPKPFVDSVVLETSRKGLPPIFKTAGQVDRYFDLVNSAFRHRRKKLLNSLAASEAYKARLERITGLLKDLDKDFSVRAEDLSPGDYIYIFKNLE